MKAWSPLRYPGGKGQMYNFVLDILKKNDLLNCHYIEPFAGGAGIAIRLLLEGYVDRISINDFDRSIYAFWHCILYETDKFVEMIRNVNVDIETWKVQKEIQARKDSEELLKLGFSTFFLNRTNRSGILKAGPIGGKKQLGDYKIDCRFNKERLIELIESIAAKKDQIFIYREDGKDFLKIVDKHNSFIFLDPPYYKKGKELYVNYFEHTDHQNLSESVQQNLNNTSFIITYDNCSEIIDMYSFLDSKIVDLNYSLSIKRKAQEVLFASNNLTL